ncbi:MAG TPA: glucose 1-dehydrogenase [Pirellulales bacterium]|jgi:3-oxoacyl-[acyl-carrier protein] reductase|nr:glucose 1-dehydrogenase [Pirellulales bacterium]
MNKLTGKVAVVTGASKGIGAAIANALASAGAAVVVNYASSKEGADRVVAEISRTGGKAVAVQGDVSKAADVQKLFAATNKAFGRLDVLVNNAGIYQFGAIEAVTEEEFHRQFNTNVLAPILTTQQALKFFGPEGGSVINISSIVSVSAPPMTTVYSATKSALDSVTRSLAQELAPKRIRVNSINPGLTLTEGLHTVGILENDGDKAMVANTPLGRIGQPDDIAPAVVFLASDDARWVTGESIRVSGGLK